MKNPPHTPTSIRCSVPPVARAGSGSARPPPHLMLQLEALPSERTRLDRDLSERNIIMAPNKIISIEERFP